MIFQDRSVTSEISDCTIIEIGIFKLVVTQSKSLSITDFALSQDNIVGESEHDVEDLMLALSDRPTALLYSHGTILSCSELIECTRHETFTGTLQDRLWEVGLRYRMCLRVHASRMR